MKKNTDFQSSLRGNKLYSFLKVAEIGSISKAAEALNYTQSGLTYMLNTLETDIGLQHLKRDHKGVSLTPEGKQLEPYFRSLIDLEKNMQNKIDELTQNDAEIIRIGTIPSIAKYCMPSLIRSFKEKYPKANVIFRSAGGGEIPKLIRDHTLDLGIIDIVHADNMDCIPLLSEQMIVAVPEEWNITPESGGISLDSLTDRPMLCFAANPLSVGIRVTTGKNFRDKITISSDGDTALSMVDEGLGFTILSERYAADCPEHVRMYPITPPVQRKLCVVTESLTDLRPLAKKFALLLQEQIS